jgi:3-oxoacyl-[acyl-carrier-protein] synthase II
VSDFDDFEVFAQTLEDSGFENLSSDFLMRNLTSNGSTHLGFKFGFHGPNQSAATACVTSTHSVGDAFRVIKYGDVDVMLAGGAYAELTPFQLAAFAKAKALSTKFNDAPQTASRPYDQDRDGFVLSQGTGLLVLEV